MRPQLMVLRIMFWRSINKPGSSGRFRPSTFRAKPGKLGLAWMPSPLEP